MKIAILGAGLIGTSIALAARRAWPEASIATFDRGPTFDDVRHADLVVLATPVNVVIDVLRTQAQHFGKAVVLDTGSTKRAIVQTARAMQLANFVGGHPMAGAASSGPREARADLFDGKRWFLIPADPSASALSTALAFVERLGAIPVVLTDDGTEHDRVMAAVSHLPQVTACMLMNVVAESVDPHALEWAGTGLRDTTRLAESPVSMWESILATNAQELKPLLLRLARDLRRFADDVESPQAIRELFEHANRHRGTLN